MLASNKIIMTCFAGRQSCMTVLLKYARHLMDKGLIDEFHAWNFARKQEDDAWLRTVFSPIPENHLELRQYNYVPTEHTLHAGGDPVTAFIRARSDAHLLLQYSGADVAEVVIGGWGNTRSQIRRTRQGPPEMECSGRFLDPNRWLAVTIRLTSSIIQVESPGTSLSLRMQVRDQGQDLSRPLKLSVSAWDQNPASYCFEAPTSTDQRFKLMHVADKARWREYYQHYTKERYKDCVIIKCDDDIVYIDPATFKSHIDIRRTERNHLLLFPAIWNNEMVAYYQQQHGLIPRDTVGEMHGEPKGFGSLWSDGKKTQRLHEHLLNNLDAVQKASLSISPRTILIPMNYRISVNFFSILSEDLDLFQQVGHDDERDLTQVLPGKWGRQIAIDMGHLVAHLSFFKQLETGMDRATVLKSYEALCSDVT